MEAPGRRVYTFDLQIDRPITDAEIDALFEAGCDDCGPETGPGGTVLHVDREAASLVTALVSAVTDVERAGLTVSGAGAPDLVTQSEIAVRTGRSVESIRLLAAGRRGPGTFPRSLNGFYSWVDVKAWFADYDPRAVDDPSPDELSYDQIVAAANILIRARTVLRGPHAPGLEQLLRAA
ncbi:hypothetical protein [Actinomycetospora termitidis]|uniref:DNA-binding protein n=1 Tax=Actinomycetospora termitidis TaxID=3053470 RepID=A0ABT7M7Q5_9PSEU|nr:hypothetical protein [Actinomycetospora sp. Odt1-22]MDL5156690.1 hypothetical protein [Actinomycetospora sp. Odt1-22]